MTSGLGCESLPRTCRVRCDNLLGPCEFLFRTLRARVWFLAHGPCMCVCESLPGHWGLGCETLSRICRLGCESLSGTMQPCEWDLAYDPVDSSVSPCLGHLLRTPAEAVVNIITDISTCTRIPWEQITTNRLGMAILKWKPVTSFHGAWCSTSQINENE